jgi:hypothetical protein
MQEFTIVNRATSSTRYSKPSSPLLQNLGSGLLASDRAPSGTTNGMAITTVPNAPVDPITGLLTPTIAIALTQGGAGASTNGGVCIIHNNGTVAQWLVNGSIGQINGITFMPNGGLFITGGGGVAYYAWTIDYLPYQSNTSSYSGVLSGWYPANWGTTSLPRNGLNGNSSLLYPVAYPGSQTPYSSTATSIKLALYEYRGASTTDKLIIIEKHPHNLGSSLQAYISTQYNTGWMPGNIQGAWLNSQVTGNLAYTNQVANLTAANYTAYYSTLSNPNGTTLLATITSVVAQSGAYYNITCTQGLTYFYGCTVVNSSANMNVRIQIAGIGLLHGSGNTNNTASTAIFDSFVAQGTGTYTIQIMAYNPVLNATISITNFFATVADDDRSVQRFGLLPVGTITKTAASTGSSVLAYSGWSTTNYLRNPIVPFTIGTGDFFFSTWIKPPSGSYSSYDHVFRIGGQGNSNAIGLKLWQGSGFLPYWYGNNTTLAQSPNNLIVGQWNHVCGGRLNGTWYIYHNAQLVVTGNTNAYSISGTTFMDIGNDESLGENSVASYALMKVSFTTPSPAQIYQMYLDENEMINGGMPSNMYGVNNDQINAMAYDPDTQLLQVGTSSGISQFKNLIRAGNTTTGVVTAISAAKGMVISQ